MSMYSSLSVRWKISAIALAGLLGLAGYLGFNVWINVNNAELMVSIRERHFPLLTTAKAAREEMTRIDELFNTAVTIGDEDFVEAANVTTQMLYESLSSMTEIVPEDASKLEDMKNAFFLYNDWANMLSSGMIAGDVDFEELSKSAAVKKAAFEESTSKLDQYIKRSQANFEASIDKANSNSEYLLKVGFLIWSINFIILAATAFAISRLIVTSIVSVSHSLDEIANGGKGYDDEIKVTTEDEIGKLVRSFNKLMSKLREKANDLASMFQNMHQGIFTIMQNQGRLVIHPEYSAHIETIFEKSDLAGSVYSDLLFSHADLGSNELDQIRTSVSSIIGEEELMYDFNSHLLPRELHINLPVKRDDWKWIGDIDSDEGAEQKILELDWDPIISEGHVDKLMVTVRDVTKDRASELKAKQQQEELTMIGQILHVSPDRFLAFIDSSMVLIEKNRQLLLDAGPEKDLGVLGALFANMHTIKGNARTLGFDSITDVVHEAETTYDHLRKSEEAWDRLLLVRELELVNVGLQRYREVFDEKLEGMRESTVDSNAMILDEEQYTGMLKDCGELLPRISHDERSKLILEHIIFSLDSINAKSLSEIISDVTNSLPSIAKELDKAKPNITIQDNQVLFKQGVHGLFVNVFTHILRNAIDHGIEAMALRVAKEKRVEGNIYVDVVQGVGCVDIIVKDDGQGLAVGKLKEQAKRDDPSLLDDDFTAVEVANLLFKSGLSTAEKLSTISGRGVGLDAVRQMLAEVGAGIEIVLLEDPMLSNSYCDFETRIHIPEGLYVSSKPDASAVESGSKYDSTAL